MVDATVSQLGGVDILVNCAGIPQHDPAEYDSAGDLGPCARY